MIAGRSTVFFDMGRRKHSRLKQAGKYAEFIWEGCMQAGFQGKRKKAGIDWKQQENID